MTAVKVLTYIVATLMLAMLTLPQAMGQGGAATYPEPIVLTAAGQSADANLVQAALARVDIATRVDNELQPEGLSDVGTLVLVMGGSQKGLGAAGVDVDRELARVDALLSEATANEVPMVAMHVGGEARRGSLSEPFIDAVASRVPALIVTQEGNLDGYFDEVASEAGAELHIVANALEVGGAFQELRSADE